MFYQHFRPIPALEPYVKCFWIIEAPGASADIPRARMPADSRATLLLNFAGESRMITGAGETHNVGIGAHLLGVHSQSYMLEHDGDTQLLAAQFRPGGLATFVRCGVSELAEQTTPLDLLWGNAGNQLCEQIYEADTTPEKLALYQNALLDCFDNVLHQSRILHALA